jgi:hypothetical protein
MNIYAIMQVGRAHPIYLNLMASVFRRVPSASEKSWVAPASSLCQRRLKPTVTFARVARFTLNTNSLPDTTISIYPALLHHSKTELLD